MDFRAFHVVAIEVTRQAMAENGGKWQKMVENGLPRLFGRKWIFAYFTPWSSRWPGRHRWASVSIGEHRHWAKHIKNFTPSKIRKFFLPLFWPFMRSWHFGADFGTPPQLTGVQGQLSFSRWGYRGDFGFPRVLRHSPTTIKYCREVHKSAHF